MRCPKCQNSEVDASGTCLICGYRESPAPAESSDEPRLKLDSRGLPGMIQLDFSDRPREIPPEELPEWRRELSRRLQQIKHKRDGEGEEPARAQEALVEVEPPVTAASAAVSTSVAAPSDDPPDPEPSPRERAPRKRAAPRRLEPPPVPKPVIKELQLFEKASRPPDKPASAGVEDLIDSIIARQAAQSQHELAPTAKAPAAGASAARTGGPDRLILLTRTLSGLIDLLIVFLCGFLFVLAADFVSGPIAVDARSWVHYGLLLVSIHFVYSLFFLQTASQTIGMMITDLRVIGTGRARPRARQLLARAAMFLVSLGAGGAGLAWGFFDREVRCLHDCVSGTQVERLARLI